MVDTTTSEALSTWLAGRRVAFVGRLGGATRKQVTQLVRELGGIPVDKADASSELIVIGAEEAAEAAQELLDDATRAAVAAGTILLISETELWQRLGLVDAQQSIHRLYTPRMLADLLGVEVNVIRRWHRRGLLVAAREVQRLPYFDFDEVAVARRLQDLTAAGASTNTIEKVIADLQRRAPHVARPLAELSTVIEGKQLLLWDEDQLIEPSGQRRLNFDLQGTDDQTAAQQPSILMLPNSQAASVEQLLAQAAQCEEEGQLPAAADIYRAALATGGPRADLCFLLAELLYRQGDLPAARERYYMALELDEHFVEARHNLGCVLAELGQAELAIAALEGALASHPEYTDAHYQLARLLDDAGKTHAATEHWRAFLELSPTSPWSDEARARIGESSSSDV